MNKITSPSRTLFRSALEKATVSAIAPNATAKAYPDTRYPATLSVTAKSAAISGSRPTMPNSVRPIPKPPKAKARSPAGKEPVFCFVTMTSSLLADAHAGNTSTHRHIEE